MQPHAKYSHLTSLIDTSTGTHTWTDSGENVIYSYSYLASILYRYVIFQVCYLKSDIWSLYSTNFVLIFHHALIKAVMPFFVAVIEFVFGVVLIQLSGN